MPDPNHAGFCADDGDAGAQQHQQQRRVLQLCDALFLQPPTSSGWDAAALAHLQARLQQHLPLSGSGEQRGGAALAAVEEALAAEAAAMRADGVSGRGAEQQQEEQQPEEQQRGAAPRQLGSPAQRHQAGPGQGLLRIQSSPVQPQGQAAQQAGEEDQGRQQAQEPSAWDLLLSQAGSQPSPALFMSQAGDNMASPGPGRQQQQGAGAGGASPQPDDALRIGTEASQPDPLAQAGLQVQQEVQRELLERRQQAQERQRQQRERDERRRQAQAEGELRQQARQAAEPAPQAAAAQERARGRRLVATTDATFRLMWRLLGGWASCMPSCHAAGCRLPCSHALCRRAMPAAHSASPAAPAGELLRRFHEQQQQRRWQVIHAPRGRGRPRKAPTGGTAPAVKLRMPPPPAVHLSAAARDLRQEDSEAAASQQEGAGLEQPDLGPTAGAAAAAPAPAAAAERGVGGAGPCAAAGWVAWQPASEAAAPAAGPLQPAPAPQPQHAHLYAVPRCARGTT